MKGFIVFTGSMGVDRKEFAIRVSEIVSVVQLPGGYSTPKTTIIEDSLGGRHEVYTGMTQVLKMMEEASGDQ